MRGPVLHLFLDKMEGMKPTVTENLFSSDSENEFWFFEVSYIIHFLQIGGRGSEKLSGLPMFTWLKSGTALVESGLVWLWNGYSLQ